jgi:hypothetical protein
MMHGKTHQKSVLGPSILLTIYLGLVDITISLLLRILLFSKPNPYFFTQYLIRMIPRDGPTSKTPHTHACFGRYRTASRSMSFTKPLAMFSKPSLPATVLYIG